MQTRYLVAGLILLSAFWLLSRSRHQQPNLEVPRKTESITNKIAKAQRKPSATFAAESPSATPTLTEQEFNRMLVEDKLCTENGDYSDHSLPKEVNKRVAKYIALFKATSPGNEAKPNPCMMALVSRDREETLKYSSMAEDKACFLIQALVKTNQFPTYDTSAVTPQDREDGLRLLQTLQHQDPDNGIYPFFRLFPLSEERREAELEDALRQFFASTKFVNPLNSLMVDLYKLGGENGTAFIFAIELVAASSHPEFYKGARIANDWLVQDPHPEAWPWMERWLESITSATERDGLFEPFISLAEMTNLRGVAASVWNMNGGGPDQPYPMSNEGFRNVFERIVKSGDFSDAFKEAHDCRSSLAAARSAQPAYMAKFVEALKRWRD